MTENSDAQTGTGKELSRNEPCHCGSGKKYKRCHGVGAAPKLSAPKEVPASGQGGAGALGGFDPSQMDPQMMAQFTQMLQRLPRGQLQRLQGIMQRAMSGKDVSREAAEFERTLPPDLQQLMLSFTAQMQGQSPGASLPAPESGMNEDDARRIVEEAAASGKISQEEAKKLLGKKS